MNPVTVQPHRGLNNLNVGQTERVLGERGVEDVDFK